MLVRSLSGAVLGSIPGILYILNTDQNLAANPFGVTLIQIGVITGAIAFGLAALSSTIVAAVKYRGSGTVKPSRMKEYMNPEIMPVIPPPSRQTSKPAEQTEVTQTPLTPLNSTSQPLTSTRPIAPITSPATDDQPHRYEDFDR